MHSYIFYQLFKDTEKYKWKNLKTPLQFPYCKHILKFSLILYLRQCSIPDHFPTLPVCSIPATQKDILNSPMPFTHHLSFSFWSSNSAWEQIRLLLPLWLRQNHTKAKFPYFFWPIAYTDINMNRKTIFLSRSCCQ